MHLLTRNNLLPGIEAEEAGYEEDEVFAVVAEDVRFALKMMNLVLEMMNSEQKMMNFVFKIMNLSGQSGGLLPMTLQ